MTNWKLIKSIDMGILVVAAISLLSSDGFWIIPSLTEKVFGLVAWSVVVAIGLAYVIYSYNRLLNM